MEWTAIIWGGVKAAISAVLGFMFPKKDPAFEAGRAEAEKDNAIAGIAEMQAAKRAEQDQRARHIADPGGVRSGTVPDGARRPFDPNGAG